MEPSYQLVPSNQASAASTKDTTNSLGLHDTLRYGPKSLATEIKGPSPLQQRLDKWDETQDNFKLTMARNVYGLHAPIRKLMERKIVGTNPHMPALPSTSNIHMDILMGRDEVLDVSDFFDSSAEVRPAMDIHSDMEKKMGL